MGRLGKRTASHTGLLGMASIALALLLLASGCDDLALKRYITVGALGIVCVDIGSGDDGNTGTKKAPMKTIQAAIKYFSDNGLTGDIHVAEGTYEVNYHAGDAIRIKEGVSLFGGYSSDFTSRDVVAYETIIIDKSTVSGADWTDPNRTVDVPAGVTSATVIDGFTIQGSEGDYPSAIYCKNSSPTISNNKIIGGNADVESIGIFSLEADPIIIDNREINGGNVVGVASPWAAMAIYSYTGADPVIENNYIFGGTGPRTAGIVSQSGTTPIINANTIHGGDGTIQGDGIQDNGSSAKVWNNVISGGSNGANSSGIACFYAGTAQIYNNTISGGGGTTAHGIRLDDGGSSTPTPYIRNNIIFTSGGGFCIWESHTDTGFPQAIERNALWDNGGTTTLYYRDAGGAPASYDTAAEVNALSWAGSNNEAAPVFADFDGSDDILDTLDDNDWHLDAGSPSSITTGGLDMSSLFKYDRDGKLRTGDGATKWSMGAYEY
jgi:hypothetical protein